MDIEKLYKLYSKKFLVDTDTRKIRKGSLYFALKGENFNGNKFAEEALNKGASFSIVDETEYQTSDYIILVHNVLNTLQELAKFHRQQLQVPIIGLTGSNGKTTTKELINAVLSTKYVITATSGNLNNHIGVPLTLLAMTPKTEIGIVEMGANHPKEIAFLCTLCQPDFGYITNFGKAHLEGFKTLEGVIEAKSELYQFLKQNNKVVFVNPNDAVQIGKTSGIEQVLFDTKNIELVNCNPFVRLLYYSEIIQSNLIGNYNFSNLAAAIAIGNYFKVSKSDTKEALESYRPSNNRSEIVKTKHNTILLDAYNANPTSMKAALENFDSIDSAYKTVILGDMFELGDNSAIEHQYIVDFTNNLNFDNCYFVGELFSKTNGVKQLFHTFEDFSKHLSKQKIKDHFILIKGSRGMALERLLKIID